jgi:CRISPR-associated protein Cas1
MQTVLEIDSSLININVDKGFLVLSRDSGTRKVPLDEIEALVINSRGAIITNHAIMRLAEYNIPIVHCGKNNLPLSITLPYANNVFRKERISAQIDASAPLNKNLWKQVVRAKITNQANVLRYMGAHCQDLMLLASRVTSGDKENKEATAARFYWERLMGKGFRRDHDQPGQNAYLNYGYAILRAVFCRAITGSGLLPELGIHHSNMMNPLCLADDLMEPIRPFVDLLIANMAIPQDLILSPAHKRTIVSLLDTPVTHADHRSHLRQCANTIMEMLLRSFHQKKALLVFPLIGDAEYHSIKGLVSF